MQYRLLSACEMFTKYLFLRNMAVMQSYERIMLAVNNRYNVSAHIPHTWIHCTSVNCKKRKTEPKKPVRVLQYPPKSALPLVPVWRNMTVQDLADSLEKPIDHVFEVLLYVNNGDLYDNPSSVLDNPDVIKEIVRKSGRKSHSVPPPDKKVSEETERRDAVPQPPASVELLQPRPPVVAVMGHVDHGKTSLLDAIRKSRVVDSEFGGITQHIGAFTVTLPSKEKITFLDTPGHAAFSAMRQRGANVTDIVVLVVAADDGVMEQTIESIRMANNAGVPIIVAVNKMDKPNADIERTKKMLVAQGVQVEDAGGDVQVVPVSALTGLNLNLLAEAIAVQAELLGLRSDPTGLVEGTVLESRTDPHRGKLSTAIVKRGTLRKGSVLVSGTAWAKVRAMFDDAGKPVNAAPPSSAVQIIGWRDLPPVGELILEVDSERRANEVVRLRQQQEALTKQEQDFEAIKKKEEAYLVEYRAQLEAKRKLGKYKVKRNKPREKEITDDGRGPSVSIIVKGDVAGSVEAILDVLDTYDCDDQCKLDIIHYGVGAVSESDIQLAAPFNAVIYAFNVDVSSAVRQLLKDNNVNLKNHNVIYRLIDDLKQEISAKLTPKDVEEIIGEAKIQQSFLVTEGKKKVPVAGSRCTKGELKKDALYKIIRDGNVIYEGKLVSMRHLKNEVGTVKKDVECGLMFEDPPEFESGDTAICYKMVPEPQVTSWDPGF